MGGFLKQSTASQSRALGPFLDDTDFKTPETGLTIANTDIKLVINGAASANKNSGGGTHRVNGVYGVTFDATDTATVGEVEVSVVVSGALPVFDKFFVVEEEVYDDLFAASAVGYLKPTTAGRDLDVSAGGEAGVDWANVGSPTTTLALTGTTVAATQKVDVDTIKTNPVVNAGTITFPTTATLASTTNITAGTITTATNLTNAPTAGDFTATMKTSIGTAVAASAVASVTGSVGGNVTGSVGSVASGGITDASYAAGTGKKVIRASTAQSGAATTITLDASASATNSIYNNCLIYLTGGTGVGQARFITAYVGATKVATVGTWQTNPDNTSTFAILPFDAVAGATAPTVGQIADAVWDEDLSGHIAVGTSGQRIALIRSGTAQAGASTTITLDASASAVDDFYNGALVYLSAGTGALQARVITDYVGSTKVATVDTWATNPSSDSVFVLLPGGGATITGNVAANVTQWNGTNVATPATAGIPDVNVKNIDNDAASASGTVTFPNATLASTTNITAGTIATVTNLTNAPTSGDLTSTMKTSVTTAATAATPIAASVTGAVGSVTGAVGSVTGAVGSVTGSVGGNVTGSIGSLATQAKADVNAEVVDAVTVDVLADSVAADGSRPTMGQALLMINRFLMERSVSTTTMTVRKEDGSTSSMTFTLNSATAPTSITRAS